MDIAHMEGVWPGDGPFGHAMRAGDDIVVLLQIKKLYSQWEQGKIESVSFFETRELLDEGGEDSLLFDLRDLTSREMKERVDRSIRIYFSKDLKDFFTSSSAG
jgi:hypothetical protein